MAQVMEAASFFRSEGVMWRRLSMRGAKIDVLNAAADDGFTTTSSS